MAFDPDLPSLTEYGVYKITNTQTGKFYIGSTALSFYKRWREHLVALRYSCHTNRLLQRSFKKHGEDAFVFSILMVVTDADPVPFEQLFIDQTKACDRKYGYNLSPTAGSVKGVRFSEEARLRLKEAFAKPDVKAKRSRALIKHYAQPGVRERHSRAVKKGRAREDVKSKVSIAQKRAQSMPDVKERLSLRSKAYYARDGAKSAFGAASKSRWSDPLYRARVTASIKAAHARPEVKAKHSEAVRLALAAPEVRQLKSAVMTAACARPEVRRRRSDSQKHSWSDPIRKALRIAKRNATRERNSALKICQAQHANLA